MLAGFPRFDSGKLAADLAAEAEVVAVPDAAAAAELLARRGVAVLCMGERIAPADAVRLLELPAVAGRRHNILLGAGADRARFQPFVDRDELFFLSGSAPEMADVSALLRGALAAWRPRAPVGDGREAAFGKRDILTLAPQLAAEEDPGRVAVLVAQAIETFLEAGRGYCLVFDELTDTLWTRASGGAETRRESASAGLIGFVLRTGQELALERLGADPRYDPEADHEGGSPDQRFVAVPAVAVDSADNAEPPRVQAVLVAVREPSRSQFTEAEVALLRLLALQVAPIFGRFALRTRLDVGSDTPEPSAAGGQVFRREAVDAYVAEVAETGNILRMSPAWLDRTYWLLAALLAGGLLFAVFGSVSQWAEGAAVVRLADRLQVAATQPGTVREVVVAPGREVAGGDPLIRLDDARQRAELERVERAFDLHLIERLRDPTGQAGRLELPGLREERRLARAALGRRSILAPHAGTVGEVRVREGHPVTPGQVVATLASPAAGGAEPTLLAALPGRFAPLLSPGMELRFEPQGNRRNSYRLRLAEVGDGVIGPAEARRVLGGEIGDAVPIAGPVVLVRAVLPAAAAGAETYREGTVGRAEVRVRSESILTALFPGLRRATEGGR